MSLHHLNIPANYEKISHLYNEHYTKAVYYYMDNYVFFDSLRETLKHVANLIELFRLV